VPESHYLGKVVCAPASVPVKGMAKVTIGVKRKLKTVKILALKFCKQCNRFDIQNPMTTLGHFEGFPKSCLGRLKKLFFVF
jgi:hypothetical protein